MRTNIRRVSATVAAAVFAMAFTSTPSVAADQDGNVEWNGLSHLVWQDLRPRAPVRGDEVTVRFQAYHNDLTAARVHWETDADSGIADASVVGRRGEYDIWAATIPATNQNELRFVVEAIDGADSDALGAAGPADDHTTAPTFLVDLLSLTTAPYGATPTPRGVFFKVWAPGANEAWVRGEFNNWGLGTPMFRVGDDFIAYVGAARPGDMYKFFFSGGIWKEDPYAKALNSDDNYNNVIVDPDEYTPVNTAFVPRPLEEWVIYQLHVGTYAGLNDPNPDLNFTRRSTFVDVTSKIDHLVDLGVNAVMLNPVQEFPSQTSGGYNPMTQWAVERSYGTQAEFREMVDALHGAGIAVIADIVYNHFDGGTNFLWEYDGSQIYYDTPLVDTAWGPQADFDNPTVAQYFTRGAEHKLTELGLNGFRVDAVSAMADGFSTPQWGAGQGILRDIHDNMRRRHAGAVSIAEEYSDGSFQVDPTPGGLGFDAKYHNQFKLALRDAVFSAAFGDPNMGALAAAIDGTGPITGTRAMNYFAMHDDVWPLSGGQRPAVTIDPSFPHDSEFAQGRIKLAEGVNMFARGIPAFVQGSEWLEDNAWESEKIDWSFRDTYAPVVRFFRDIIGLRTTEPALFANSFAAVRDLNEGGNVLVWERSSPDGSSFIIIANFANTNWGSYRVGLPLPGDWSVAINSEAAIYGGSGYGSSGALTVEDQDWSGLGQSAVVQVPARGLMVLQRNAPGSTGCNPADLAEPFEILNSSDVNAFVSAFLAGTAAADLADPAGILNSSDVNGFVSAFLAGCP